MDRRVISVATIIAALVIIGIVSIVLANYTQSSQPTLTPTPASTPTPTPTITPNSTINPTTSPVATPTPTPQPTPIAIPTKNTVIEYTYTIVKIFPHDTTAFTQGLVYDNGILFESTGKYGESTLRRVDLETGQVLTQIKLAKTYFAEGLALVDDRLIQLTWQNKVSFIYNKDSLAQTGNFTINTEGWGLTYDGTHLIMSDGTANICFLDPTTYQKTGEIVVKDGDTAIININELEYINGSVYANIWLQQRIAIIDPKNGLVTGWIDLDGIYQPQNDDNDSVLNGIAYDKAGNRLFITGKNWPYIYEIKIQPKNNT